MSPYWNSTDWPSARTLRARQTQFELPQLKLVATTTTSEKAHPKPWLTVELTMAQ